MMVRKLAEEYGLIVANKPDSQEICFIGDEGYKAFIEKRVAPNLRPKGVIQTLDGRVVGEHEGIHRYTIGQRKGLNIHGTDTQDLWVVGFEPRNHVLIVGPEHSLLQDSLIATDVNWIAPVLAECGLRSLECSAKIRSMAAEAPCRVTLFENSSVHVEFTQKQRAITPGQAIVFYQGREVLGGGFIDHAGNP
jgi:tRNA-specific 2-thiouridylase